MLAKGPSKIPQVPNGRSNSDIGHKLLLLMRRASIQVSLQPHHSPECRPHGQGPESPIDMLKSRLSRSTRLILQRPRPGCAVGVETLLTTRTRRARCLGGTGVAHAAATLLANGGLSKAGAVLIKFSQSRCDVDCAMSHFAWHLGGWRLYLAVSALLLTLSFVWPS